MNKFEATHLAISTHLRPLICTEEAYGFHKRLKMIHDPVNFVDPCAVSETESPIPPDISVHQDLKIWIVDSYLSAAVFQEKLGLEDDVRKVFLMPVSIDASTSLLIDTPRLSQHAETETYKSGGKEEEELEEEKKDQG
ncbi:hypothetical protein F2Q68_00005126 [Brassica cretica]|uniref:Uncharacterized protein n=2 Tax=Brassica cretica TaxID=69181 RepID=A0ABQ7CAX0_BRACR|nr:hypothetical protein F2Q68_00005126 [Brassica cretica]KAF3549415.1 hypothetical protein DY000_02007754 [Brassica cretica]